MSWCTSPTNRAHLWCYDLCWLLLPVWSVLTTIASVICADYCCQWLQHNDKLDFLCCNSHSMNKDGIKSPTPIVLNFLTDLSVTCTTCKVATTAREYGQHKCRLHQTSPPLTYQWPSCNVNQYTNSDCRKTSGRRLVKRMLAETKGNIINVPTKGRYVYIASALHNYLSLHIFIANHSFGSADQKCGSILCNKENTTPENSKYQRG